MRKLEPKPDWEPTRLQLAKSHLKDYLGAAILLGVMALGALLYFALMAFTFHHLPRWLP